MGAKQLRLGFEDTYGTCEKIKAKGGKIVRQPCPLKHGTTEIAFVDDNPQRLLGKGYSIISACYILNFPL